MDKEASFDWSDRLPTLAASRIVLRHLREEDVPALFDVFSDAEREGYLRERYHVNGEVQDTLFYGLLRPEWTEKKRPGGVR